MAPQRDEIFKQKVNDCVQHIILQKFSNFHAIRLWNFQNICNEIGWPRFLRHPVHIYTVPKLPIKRTVLNLKLTFLKFESVAFDVLCRDFVTAVSALPTILCKFRLQFELHIFTARRVHSAVTLRCRAVSLRLSVFQLHIFLDAGVSIFCSLYTGIFKIKITRRRRRRRRRRNVG